MAPSSLLIKNMEFTTDRRKTQEEVEAADRATEEDDRQCKEQVKAAIQSVGLLRPISEDLRQTWVDLLSEADNEFVWHGRRDGDEDVTFRGWLLEAFTKTLRERLTIDRDNLIAAFDALTPAPPALTAACLATPSIGPEPAEVPAR